MECRFCKKHMRHRGLRGVRDLYYCSFCECGVSIYTPLPLQKMSYTLDILAIEEENPLFLLDTLEV